MITKVFSVYDSKASLWMNPFFMQANGQAIRAFSDEANDPKSQLGRHPTDFVLFCIGEFDDNTGQLVAFMPPTQLGMASDYLKPAAAGAPMLFDAAELQRARAAQADIDRVHAEMLASTQPKKGN